jgi:putative ATPase
MAIESAISAVKQTGNLPVPLHLRNAPTKLMKQLDYGKDYKYAHSFQGNFVDQEFLPEQISGNKFYQPGNNPKETEVLKKLQSLWKKYNY